ncbi:MAG: Fe(3+) ABC transporter substrate-binding protein [Trueperaceae bacterium]
MNTPLRLLALSCLLALLTSVSAQSDVVNVYSARHYDSDEELFNEFTEQTGIEVNVIEANADELIERIRSEGANSPADVIITVDAGRLWRADQAGLLAPVESPVLEAAIPESLRHPEGKWFGLTRRVRAIVYNRETVDSSELSTYENLADPEWEGRVCIRSSGNVYNQSLVASLIEAHGAAAAEEWAEGLVENFARNPQGGDTDQILAVAAGECDVAVANHYYLARLITSDDPADREVADRVEIFFPNQESRGAHVNISGAGVVTSAPNQRNAIRFIEFLTTPQAQEIFARGNNEFPVVEGVPASDVAQGFGEFEADSVSVAAYGENNPEAVRIMDRAGWR